MGRRTNTAQWLPNQKRWQIKVQKDGQRRTFTSANPGRTGQREANRKADAWLDDGICNTTKRCSEVWAEYLISVKATAGTSYIEQVEKLKALKEELAKVPEPCGELDAVIQVAVGCESKKYWNPIGTYRVVIDGTEYMVELEEETERFR